MYKAKFSLQIKNSRLSEAGHATEMLDLNPFTYQISISDENDIIPGITGRWEGFCDVFLHDSEIRKEKSVRKWIDLNRNLDC